MAKKKVVKTTTTTTVEEIVEGNGKSQIVCILDSSTSMAEIIVEAIGGFNDFLKKQKEEEGEATITVSIFDSAPNFKIVYDNIDLKKAEPITSAEWYPRGMTALYDAIGKTIKHVEDSHRKLSVSARPDKVLVAIVTDGENNASREYNQSSVKELIKAKERDGWQFVYLAADQDAFAAGTSIGVSGGNTLRYRNSGAGNVAMFATLNNATSHYRNLSLDSVDYNIQASNVMAFASAGTGQVGESVNTLTVDGDNNNTITFNSNNISQTLTVDGDAKKKDSKKS